jgi:hypothetical protein
MLFRVRGEYKHPSRTFVDILRASSSVGIDPAWSPWIRIHPQSRNFLSHPLLAQILTHSLPGNIGPTVLTIVLGLYIDILKAA